LHAQLFPGIRGFRQACPELDEMDKYKTDAAWLRTGNWLVSGHIEMVKPS